jgi:uncharacterized membrane protein
MKLLRGSTLQLLVLVLSLAGVGDALYLTIVHYQGETPLCPTTGAINCAQVLSSRYAVVPGTTLPISIPGLGWCLVVVLLALISLLRRPEPVWLRPIQFVWSLAGIVTVLYLVYIELVVLHAICIWCTVLHFIILIIFLIALSRLLEGDEGMVKEQGRLPVARPAPSPRSRSRYSR